MVDQKLTQLTSSDAIALEDLRYFVDDPTGTPVSKARSQANIGADLYTGTAFPTANLYDGLTFLKTDEDVGMLCFYDLGNTQWLTVQEFSVSANGDALSASETNDLALLRSDLAVYVTRTTWKWFIDTTNDATHYWTFNLRGVSDDEASTTSIRSRSTNASSPDVWVRSDLAASTPKPTNNGKLDLVITEVDTPGDLSYNMTVYFRYVVT